MFDTQCGKGRKGGLGVKWREGGLEEGGREVIELVRMEGGLRGREVSDRPGDN